MVEIRDLIKSLGKKHTVILSSHILSEVQHMCDEILIISKGKLIAYDTTENLEKMLQPKVTLEVETDALREESEQVLSAIRGIESTEYVEEKDGLLKIHIETTPEQEMAVRKVLSLEFARINRAVLKSETVKANLEEIFIELTSADIQDDEEDDPEEAEELPEIAEISPETPEDKEVNKEEEESE